MHGKQKNKHKGNSQRSTLVTNRIFPYLSYKDWFPLVSCSCTVKQTKGGKELNMAKMHHCSTNSFYRIAEVTNKEGSFASKQTITKLWHTIIQYFQKLWGQKTIFRCSITGQQLQNNESSALTFGQFLLLGNSQTLEFYSLCKCGRPTRHIQANK